MTQVDVGGALRLDVRLDGPATAPAALLLNSIACDQSMWDPQVPRMSERWRVVRFDARGHGASGAPSGPYRLDDLGRDALAVLDTLGIERAHLVGVSLGGLVGLWVAIHHPGRVHRLVLVSTAARIGTPQAWRERAALVRTDGMANVVDLQLGRFFTDAFRVANPEVVGRIASGIRAMSPEAYAATCLALADADLREALDRVQAPTLVVVGRADVSTPPAEARWLLDHIPKAQLVELDDAAHLCTLEQPERFTEEIVRFLSKKSA